MMDKALKKVGKFLQAGKWNSYLVIFPTFELVNLFIRRLIDENGIKGALFPNIFTFDGLVHKVLSQEVVEPPSIGDIQKQEILEEIFRILLKSNQLTYFRSDSLKPGIIKAISQCIAELKQTGASPESLFTVHSSAKLKDLNLIFQQYKAVLDKAGLIDREDRFFTVLHKLRAGDTDFLKEVEYLYADWYVDTTPIQQQIFEVLSNRIPDHDILIKPYAASSINEVLAEISANHQERGELHLAQALFSPEKSSCLTPVVSMARGWGKEGEVRQLARIIKNLAKRGTDLDDIAVVCRDPGEYRSELKSVFAEAGIPLALNLPQPLRENPLIQSLLAFLQASISLETKFSLAQFLDNPYIGYDDRCTDILVNWARARGDLTCFGWREAWLQTVSDLNRPGDDSNLEDCTARLDEFLGIMEDSAFKGSPGELADRAYRILERLGFRKQMTVFSCTLDLNSRIELTARDAIAMETLASILEEMKSALSSREITWGSFIERLKNHIENCNYYPEIRDEGVTVFSPSQIRGLEYKAVLIMGLREGQFPRPMSPGWVINDKERLQLRPDIILPVSYEIYDREKLLFYFTVQACSQELWLIYQAIDDDGQSSLPSLYIEEVEYCLQKRLQANQPQPGLPVGVEAVSLKEHLMSLLVGGHQEKALQLAEQLKAFPVEHVRRLLEVDSARNQPEFSCWEGNLQDENIQKQLQAKAGKKTFSVSTMNYYARCPLKYFFAHELELTPLPEEEEELNPLDKGRLLHRVLYLVMSSDLSGDEEQIKYLVETTLDKVCLELGINGAQYAHPWFWNLEKQIMAGKITELVRSEIKRGNFKPRHLEWKFGFESPFYINTPAGPVRFRGVIDRIDQGQDGQYAIYDYKNNVVESRENVLNGTALQLPIYVLAVKQLLGDIAGAGYISINQGKVSFPVIRQDYKTSLGADRIKTLNDEQWEQFLEVVTEYVGDYYQGISSGYFPPRPRDCSYCDFKDICRYNSTRIWPKNEGEGASQHEA